MRFWKTPKINARKPVPLFDNIKNVKDIFHSRAGRLQTVDERIGIRGRVTAIKNYGRRDEEYACKDKRNLVTTQGIDRIHESLYNTATAIAAFENIGVSVDSDDPTAAETTSTFDEITTGGLGRKNARTDATGDISHIDDSSRTDLSVIFTASAAHTAVHKAGLFDVGTADSGVLIHAAAFDNDVSLSTNDTLTVEWQITLG